MIAARSNFNNKVSKHPTAKMMVWVGCLEESWAECEYHGYLSFGEKRFKLFMKDLPEGRECVRELRRSPELISELIPIDDLRVEVGLRMGILMNRIEDVQVDGSVTDLVSTIAHAKELIEAYNINPPGLIHNDARLCTPSVLLSL